MCTVPSQLVCCRARDPERPGLSLPLCNEEANCDSYKLPVVQGHGTDRAGVKLESPDHEALWLQIVRHPAEAVALSLRSYPFPQGSPGKAGLSLCRA